MSLLSRCHASDRFDTTRRSWFPRRPRVAGQAKGLRATFADFAEEVGILFRYAAGLDYYDRQNISR